MTTLTKDTVISISGGDYVPGTPGSPARQAWTEIIRVPGVPARAAFIPIDASAIFPEYHWVMLPAIPDTYTVINHPAVAAVAPTPPTGGPLTFVAHNNLGWNSGAVNMTAISSNGTVSLTGPAATGTVIGLASADPQGDYRQIAHGLYFTERKVFVVEHGVRKTGGQDAPGNAMLITRTDGVVSYSVGGVVIFTSAEASPGTVLVAAVFYAAHDYVKDVVVTTTEPLAARGGSGYGILPRLSGLGSNYAYSGAASRLPALVSTASDAGEQPSYAIAEAILAPVRGSAHGLTGGVGTGAATLPTLEGFGSDRPMGTGRGTLPALRSYGAEQPTTGWSHITAPMATGTASASPTHAIYTANLTAPMATLYAQSHDSTGENAADITAPMATLSAFMGSGAKIKAPVPTVSATATGTNWLKADVTAPMATLEAAGTVSGTSQANIRGIMASAVGYGGMVAAVTITGHPTVQATVTNGGVCSANLAGPMAELTLFEVTREDTCSADIIAPMGKMGGSLAAWITAPMATLVAIGSATVAATYEAYAVNLNHKPRRSRSGG